MAGDIVWSTLAFASIVGVSEMGPLVFDILGAGCGLYLIYLGIRAMSAKNLGEAPMLRGHNPYRAGFPVRSHQPEKPIRWRWRLVYRADRPLHDGPELVLAPADGPGGLDRPRARLCIDVVLGWVADGAPLLLTHGVIVTRVIGVTFVLFGIKSLVDAGRSFQGPVAMATFDAKRAASVPRTRAYGISQSGRTKRKRRRGRRGLLPATSKRAGSTGPGIFTWPLGMRLKPDLA